MKKSDIKGWSGQDTEWPNENKPFPIFWNIKKISLASEVEKNARQKDNNHRSRGGWFVSWLLRPNKRV
jgi:hypothetical protein